MLFAACNENETAPTPREPALYEFVSVEYAEPEIVPVREVADEKTLVNTSDTSVEAHYAFRSEDGFSSAFFPDSSPGSGLDECWIPIPEVDAEGVLYERFSTEAPFRPGATYTFVANTTRIERDSELPSAHAAQNDRNPVILPGRGPFRVSNI